MSELSFPDALAQLLKDSWLRERFATDPVAVIRELGVDSSAAAALTTIPVAMLEHQANTLLRKRFEAVRKYIPATLTMLNNQAWERFVEYAAANWPEGHRRHLIDAIGFCRWLRRWGMCCEGSELNAARFALSTWPLGVYFIWHPSANGTRHLALQLFYRTSRASNEWRFYIAFKLSNVFSFGRR